MIGIDLTAIQYRVYVNTFHYIKNPIIWHIVLNNARIARATPISNPTYIYFDGLRHSLFIKLISIFYLYNS